MTISKDAYVQMLNAFRQENPNYLNTMPEATVDNILNVGNFIASHPVVLNDFFNVLNKVVETYVNSPKFDNPLGSFKRASSGYGDTIEEIFVGLTDARLYDDVQDGSDLYSTETPNIAAAYHRKNREEKYKVTVKQHEQMKAVLSAEGMDNIVNKMIGSLTQSNNRDEYKLTKALITSAYVSRDLHLVEVGDVDVSPSELITQARMYYNKTRFEHRYNAYGVRTMDEPGKLNMIMDIETEARTDVNVLANAFNMSKSDFLGKRKVIDSFHDGNIVAGLFSDDFFVIADNLIQSTSRFDESSLKTNYWLHVHQTISRSPFATGILFVKEIPEDYEARMVLDPINSTFGHELRPSLDVTAELIGFDKPGVDLSTATFTANVDNTSAVTVSVTGNKITLTPKDTGAKPGDVITLAVTATYGEVGTEKEITKLGKYQISKSYKG